MNNGMAIGAHRHEILNGINLVVSGHSDQRGTYTTNAQALGLGITILSVHPPALDRECRTRVHRRPSFRLNGIAFRRIAELRSDRSSVVCITNTGWRKLRREGLFKMSEP